ncbi:MAG: double-strand break repair protein AddB [Pseudomonadota bacterium]
MFDPSPTPRVFGCAPGTDFPAALIGGLSDRLKHAPPDAWARTTIFVNSARMARRVTTLLQDGPPRLLPRIRLLTHLDDLLPDGPLPPAISPLRRRLELAPLVARLIDQERDLGARNAGFDLADSLATLMDEMQGEGVSAEDILSLDVSEHSEHWARAQRFFAIANDYVTRMASGPDGEARQRQTVQTLASAWAANPPTAPFLIAGSTGSRGTTQLLMQAVARLPQGALILPGFDFDTPASVWDQLTAPLRDPGLTREEDHPQFRFAQLMHQMDLTHADITAWSGATPSPERNAVVSLALRPAPITDAWRSEGPNLVGKLPAATAKVTLIEAETTRAEATAIALRLRHAAETGEKAALVTPDRMLTRQVTAALARWNIRPDDSAGIPLHLSPPGRYLRHIADLMRQPLDAEALITLLKHPLTHSGGGRAAHQLNTQRLELRMRRDGLPYPNAENLRATATKAAPQDDTGEMADWADWIGATLQGAHDSRVKPLGDWIAAHLVLAETLANGPAPTGPSELWQQDAGEAAQAITAKLETESPHGGEMSAYEYAALVSSVLAGGEVRNADTPYPGIMIWGTLEARVQGADLVILAGLNDGTWPEAPPPDPWLNRKMRAEAGLLLPERRIGLSAHDFQQAIAAPEVWLTRAIRSDDAETVPSRWINRLRNLITGLEGGADSWEAMQKRGAKWLAQAGVLDHAPPVARASRPAPQPPVAARPRKLSVTEIQTLIRDPFAIYAKHVLRLRALRPLSPTPDALLRGTVLHDIMERFVRNVVVDPDSRTCAALLQHAQTVLAGAVPWPAARALWHARFAGAADWLVETEAVRLSRGTPAVLEDDAKGSLLLPAIGFEIHGRADRIDLDADGNAILYDYKSSQPPTPKVQKHFDKQLLIEAAMVENGGFKGLGPRTVSFAQFIGMTGQKTSDVPLDKEPPAQAFKHLFGLLSAYLEPDKGYLSRRAMNAEADERDYDQLARFGEWDASDEAVPEALT